jgi:hypothetical protein
MAGGLVAVVAIGFFVQRLVVNASTMPHVAWSPASVGVSVASVLLALTAILLTGVVWHVLLNDQQVRHPFAKVQALFLVSQFGKYFPGNIGQFVGRVVLARDIGIPVPITLATMLTETLWSIGTALGISALSLFLFLGGHLSTLPRWFDGAGLLVCFAAAIAAPWAGVTLLKRIFPGLVGRLFAGSELRPPGMAAALRVSTLYVCCYGCMGLILRMQAQVYFGAPAAPLLEVSGFFALAWLAGYLLPGAPAGIGVRESVLLVLFSPLYGESAAIALGITLRLTTTAADALAFAIGWTWRYMQRRGDCRDQGDVNE